MSWKKNMSWTWLVQGCPVLLLDDHCPVEFSSNPNYSRMCWAEMDSAGQWPYRTEFIRKCDFTGRTLEGSMYKHVNCCRWNHVLFASFDTETQWTLHTKSYEVLYIDKITIRHFWLKMTALHWIIISSIFHLRPKCFY